MTTLLHGHHFSHRVPPEISGFGQSVEGKLYLSKTGYIYASQPKLVLWIKLLGLAASLPLRAVINKIYQSILCLFDRDIPSRGAYDLPHLFHLSGIAWKGVIGWNKTLAERASQFALAELDNHFDNRMEGMILSRSERLKNGYYTAPCMQPFCKEEEYAQSFSASQKKPPLQNKLREFLRERECHQKAKGTFLQRHSYLQGRVKRYADIAVVRQLGCLRAQAAAGRAFDTADETISSTLVEETTKVDCCGTTCYREKRICCGTTCYREKRICCCVYKIECCEETTRWAIDCICCMLCFSPANGDCCIVA